MISFIIGFIIGGIAGVFSICMVSVNRDDREKFTETDKEIEEEIEKLIYKRK